MSGRTTGLRRPYLAAIYPCSRGSGHQIGPIRAQVLTFSHRVNGWPRSGRAARLDLLEQPREEHLRPFVGRVVEDPLGWAALDEHALLDEVDAVRRLAGSEERRVGKECR